MLGARLAAVAPTSAATTAALKRQRRLVSSTGGRRTLSVLFFGSDDFSSRHLSRLLSEQDLVARVDVVTPPDRARGRGLKISQCPLKVMAQSHGLRHFDAPPVSLSEWKMPTMCPYDMAVVVSFNYFLPWYLLSRFRTGSVNVHPSLLPKYRGAAPIQHTLLNGDDTTGVSIIDLDPQTFDAGRILKQVTIPIPNAERIMYAELEDVLATAGADLLVDTIRHFDEAKRNARKQDASQVTHAPKITKEIGQIDWDRMSAEQVFNLYRAVSHQIPLSTTFQSQQLHLSDLVHPADFSPPIDLTAGGAGALPGTLWYDKAHKVLWIRAGASPAWVGCRRLKLANRKWLQAQDFVHGYKITSLVDRFAPTADSS
ncbi:Methionyl-tRNA formyltransferase [Sorochytrium milnesiophthora]